MRPHFTQTQTNSAYLLTTLFVDQLKWTLHSTELFVHLLSKILIVSMAHLKIICRILLCSFSKLVHTICLSVNQSVSQSVSQLVGQSISQLVTSQSVSQSVIWSISQSVSQLVGQSVDQSFSQSVSWPFIQPVSRWVSQYVCQPAKSVIWSLSQFSFVLLLLFLSFWWWLWCWWFCSCLCCYYCHWLWWSRKENWCQLIGELNLWYPSLATVTNWGILHGSPFSTSCRSIERVCNELGNSRRPKIGIFVQSGTQVLCVCVCVYIVNVHPNFTLVNDSGSHLCVCVCLFAFMRPNGNNARFVIWQSSYRTGG